LAAQPEIRPKTKLLLQLLQSAAHFETVLKLYLKNFLLILLYGNKVLKESDGRVVLLIFPNFEAANFTREGGLGGHVFDFFEKIKSSELGCMENEEEDTLI
jgi:hypothetical protein